MLNFFLTIAEITLAMTPILLLTLLFTRFARRWSAGCRCAIWCVLLLRLAIPLNFSLPAPVIDLAPALPEPMPPTNYFQSVPADRLTPVSIDTSADYVYFYLIPETSHIEQTATLPTVDVNLDPTVVLSWLWLIGAAAVLAYTALNCFLSAARLRRWKLPVNDERLLDALNEAREAVGLRRKVRLWLCPQISSPMLRGLFTPEILLPHSDYTNEQLSAILRHELIHCRRGDLWWKLAGMIATALHFFNPLVWIARNKMEVEMEQSCDDAVFRLGDVSRKTYGETMLAVAREGLTASTAGLNTQFHGSSKTLKARFANILDSSAKKAGIWIIVLVLILAVICGGLISCRRDKPTDSDETAVIEAALASADSAWNFDAAYVSFDGDTATLSALYNPGGHADSALATQTGWADITLACRDGEWTVTDGLDGKLNWRSTVAEEGRRNAREQKRTAEIEALIQQVWSDDGLLALREKIEQARRDAAALQEHLENEHIQYTMLQQQLATLKQQNSISMQEERAALEEKLNQIRERVAAVRNELTQRQQQLQAILPKSLQNAAYPLAWRAESIPHAIPAQAAEPGMELSCPVGTPVLAVADGVVLAAGYHPVDGNFVLIDHGDGGFTRTCWLSSVSVAEGDTVKRSHQIGLSGRSGHARGEGVRFVLSLGTHASSAEMLWAGASDSVVSPPFSITVPVAGEPTFAYLSPNVGRLADGTIFIESSVEYFAPADTPVYAAASGTVTLANEDPALGCYVQIDHGNGFETRYVFLRSLTVKVGQTVDSTTQIGTIAPTGDGREPRVGMTICQNGYTAADLLDYISLAAKRDPHTGQPEQTSPTTVTPVPDTTAPIASERPFSLISPLLDGTYKTGIGFGWQEAYGNRVFQKEVEYIADAGTPVFASADGTVKDATYHPSLGNYVTIEHRDSFSTTYAHLGKIAVGIAPGVQIAQGTILGEVGSTGDSLGPHLGFMLQRGSDYTDPAAYIHFSLRPAYTYTLHSSLPKLHSWTYMADLHLSSDTISRLGSEYTAIDYVLSQLYGKDHKFGQFNLLPVQMIINGMKMDSVWQIQQSSSTFICIAMQAGGGQMFLAEGAAPYLTQSAVWREIINANTSSTLGQAARSAKSIEKPNPLFTDTVWFVRNEQYESKLTGAATAKLEVPVVYEAVADPELPPFTADMPMDGLLTREIKVRIAAEYKTALSYLVRKYGETHGYTALTLTTSTFENYDSVWMAKKPDGSSIVIAMKPGGESYLIGSEQSLTTGWFSAPRFDESAPFGDARLTPSKADSRLPRPITFALPLVIDFKAENPVRYYAEDERFGPYDGWRYFGLKGEIQTVSVPARSTYTSQMYSSYVRNDIGRIFSGKLPNDPMDVAEMMETMGDPLWKSMGRTPTAVNLIEIMYIHLGDTDLCRGIYTLQEGPDKTGDWIVYFLCEGDTVSAFAVRANEMLSDVVLPIAEGIIKTYRPAT